MVTPGIKCSKVRTSSFRYVLIIYPAVPLLDLRRPGSQRDALSSLLVVELGKLNYIRMQSHFHAIGDRHTHTKTIFISSSVLSLVSGKKKKIKSPAENTPDRICMHP